MVCKCCGRNTIKIQCDLCPTCYLKYLAERKQSETYTDRRFRPKEISNTTKEIIKRLKAGEKQVDISKKFGVSRQWVSYINKTYVGRI